MKTKGKQKENKRKTKGKQKENKRRTKGMHVWLQVRRAACGLFAARAAAASSNASAHR
jgi:hypothetical protein